MVFGEMRLVVRYKINPSHVKRCEDQMAYSSVSCLLCSGLDWKVGVQVIGPAMAIGSTGPALEI